MTLDERELVRLIKQYPQEADNWLRGVALEMENDLKQGMLDSPADGETYKRGKGRVHIASSPGNAPRPDMGALLGSINTQRRGRLHYEHRDGVEYGIFMEFGTEHIAPRPWVNPVYEDWRKKILADAERNLIK